MFQAEVADAKQRVGALCAALDPGSVSLPEAPTLDQIDWKCGHCHDLKTYRGWQDHGPPGRRRWTHQPHTADPPAPPAPPAQPGDLFGDPAA